MTIARITVDSHQMGGIPCVRGLRIPVATIVGMVAEGMTNRDILDEYIFHLAAAEARVATTL